MVWQVRADLDYWFSLNEMFGHLVSLLVNPHTVSRLVEIFPYICYIATVNVTRVFDTLCTVYRQHDCKTVLV